MYAMLFASLIARLASSTTINTTAVMTSGAARAAQLHYWSLTRKRIGSRFLGLDQAGNVLLYPCYRTSWFGGWFPVTLAFETNRPQTLLMENGHPMHHKSAAKLQQLFLDRQRERESLAVQQLKDKIKKELSSDTGKSENGAPNFEAASESDDISHVQQFVKEVQHPAFMKTYLRVSKVTTAAYLILYYLLWGGAALLCLQLYRAFKRWLNPPARQGLENLEKKLMYYPNCVQDILDEYFFSTAAVQYAAGLVAEYVWNPLKSSASEVLAPLQVTWAVKHQRRVSEDESAAAAVAELAERQAAQRRWWERSILSLLFAIIVMCFL